jgi:hypothetical protein
VAKRQKGRCADWLKCLAATFSDEDIENLVPRYDKCLNISDDYLEKWFNVDTFCNKDIFL